MKNYFNLLIKGAKMFKKFFLFLFILMPSFIFAICSFSCDLNTPASYSSGVATPNSIAFSPSGNCLAVANHANNSVSMFTVNSNCTLTLAGTFSSGGTNPVSVAFSPSGHCLAVANSGSNNISMFTVNSNCSLTSAGTFGSLELDLPNALAFSPTGSCLAVVNRNITSPSTSTISTFTVGSNCSLTFVQTYNIGAQLGSQYIAFSPSGTCLAVTNFSSLPVGTFSIYPFNASTCKLGSPILQNSGGNSPTSLAFSSNGSCLAVANQASNNVSIYTLNQESDCSVTFINTFSTASSPTSVAFSPSGNCLAVSSNTTNTISMFTVNSNCSLTLDGSPISTGGTNPVSIAFSPTGSCFAVANQNSNSISIFPVIILPVVTLSSAPIGVQCTENLTGIIANFTCGTPPYTQVTISNGTSAITLPNPTNSFIYPVVSDTTTYTFTVTDSNSNTASASIVA